MPSLSELHTTHPPRTARRSETETNDSLYVSDQSTPQLARIEPKQGPPLVFITPPLSRVSLPGDTYDPPSEASLDISSPVSETPRYRFRIRNPDPETKDVPTFVYTPPPLPETHSAPYSVHLAAPPMHYLPASVNNYHAQLSQIPTQSEPLPQREIIPNRRKTAEWPEGASEYDTYSDTGGTYWKRPPLDLAISEGSRSGFSQSDTSLRRFSASSRWKGKRVSVQQTEDMSWATRPPPETVYGHLQEFFPYHDVDKVVIDVNDVDSSPATKTHLSKRRPKKSIRMVAEEQADRNIRLGSRRRTKLWDSNVEELRM